MKKLLILFLFVSFTGCAQLQMMSRPKTIGGETCMQSPRLRVFEVLDDGILAYLCPTKKPSYYDDLWENCRNGDLVFMSVTRKANDYVDNQKISLTKNQCFVGDGVFKYTTKYGREATVRNIKILEGSTPAN
jgi:hypothetical protein